MSIPKCNCKGCPDRTVTPNCHTTCQNYLEFTKYLEEKRQSKLKEKAGLPKYIVKKKR